MHNCILKKGSYSIEEGGHNVMHIEEGVIRTHTTVVCPRA